MAAFHAMSHFFFLYRLQSYSFSTIFDTVSSYIDKALSINSSAKVFVFRGFKVAHKDWLAYFSETDATGELCYNFSISNNLTHIGNFHACIPGSDSDSSGLLGLFLSSDLSICCPVASLLGNFDYVIESVSIDFSSRLVLNIFIA